MAIRFTNQIIGTQFHPEADPIGMKMYLLQEDKKTAIIKNHGEDKYLDMNEEPISKAKYAYLAYSFHLLIQLPDVGKGRRGRFNRY